MQVQCRLHDEALVYHESKFFRQVQEAERLLARRGRRLIHTVVFGGVGLFRLGGERCVGELEQLYVTHVFVLPYLNEGGQ